MLVRNQRSASRSLSDFAEEKQAHIHIRAYPITMSPSDLAEEKRVPVDGGAAAAQDQEARGQPRDHPAPFPLGQERSPRCNGRLACFRCCCGLTRARPAIRHVSACLGVRSALRHSTAFLPARDEVCETDSTDLLAVGQQPPLQTTEIDSNDARSPLTTSTRMTLALIPRPLAQPGDGGPRLCARHGRRGRTRRQWPDAVAERRDGGSFQAYCAGRARAARAAHPR